MTNDKFLCYDVIFKSIKKLIIMTQRLKSWESPRRQGRNDKGKGGSARLRQIKKQMKLLRRKLKGETITKQTKIKSDQTDHFQNYDGSKIETKLKQKNNIKIAKKEGYKSPSFFLMNNK